MDRFRVVCVSEIKGQIPDWIPVTLSEKGIEFSSYPNCRSPDDIVKHASEADVIWLASNSLSMNADTLSALDICGAVVKGTSGTDNVSVDAATELGIIVTSAPEAMADSVSDHAIGLIFAVVRQICRHDRDLRKGDWNADALWPRRTLNCQTLGLVGFGHIPKLIVRKLSGFKLRVLAYDPFVSKETMEDLNVEAAELDPLLAESDIVSLHTSLTSATRGLINESRLEMMKKTAVLVNTSRGAVIDEKALEGALRDNRIAAAGLDVFTSEPLEPNHPFLTLNNIVLTPHAASATEGVAEASYKLVVESIVALSRGKRPRHIVNPGVNSRWKLE